MLALTCGGTRRSAVTLGYEGKNLALLLPQIAIDGVRPHLHRTSVHLLLTGFLKVECNLLMREFAPSLRLPDPLPVIFRFGPGALHAPQFHFAAIFNFAHGSTSCR